MSVETEAPAADSALCTPHVAFYLASTADPINSDHPLWCQPLPRSRTAAVTSVSDEPDILYKEYFSAIAAFCAADNWGPVTTAIMQQQGRPVTPDAISAISVFLEKHGAFYHPARLVVRAEDQVFSFVINVAVSASGRAILPREVQALSWLGEHRPFGWVPTVYTDMRQTLSGGREIALFLGTWFDGYHEFHLTASSPDQAVSAVIWDGAVPPTCLLDDQMAAVYQQAALILTACYDPVTTQQIFPWHHAAGDFVVKLTDDGVSVRLITVRDRVPVLMVDETDVDEGAILEGLVLFFIHLTLRMRLDRLDGVGKVIFGPETMVAPVVSGFFQGLDLCARLSGLFGDVPAGDVSAGDFPVFFRHWFSRHSSETLGQLTETVVETFFPENTEERRIVSLYQDAHLEMLRGQMKSGTSGFP
ncbi:hypothetical protein LJC47_05190 [Desulfosarcina sp. OttesenSCG-928-B08]|nr:hypothetical protein [Desulfosarcina sp. OttesenSCG-928-B08]